MQRGCHITNNKYHNGQGTGPGYCFNSGHSVITEITNARFSGSGSGDGFGFLDGRGSGDGFGIGSCSGSGYVRASGYDAESCYRTEWAAIE